MKCPHCGSTKPPTGFTTMYCPDCGNDPNAPPNKAAVPSDRIVLGHEFINGLFDALGWDADTFPNCTAVRINATCGELPRMEVESLINGQTQTHIFEFMKGLTPHG